MPSFKSDHYAKPFPLHENNNVPEGQAGRVACYHYSFMPAGQTYPPLKWVQGNTAPMVGPFKTRKACDAFIKAQNAHLAELNKSE